MEVSMKVVKQGMVDPSAELLCDFARLGRLYQESRHHQKDVDETLGQVPAL